MAHELIFEEVVGHVIENRFEKWKKKNVARLLLLKSAK